MTDQPTPHYRDEQTTVYHGDCIATMDAMPAESVDSIVTDPPYGLGFMGKKWDGLPPSLEWAEACYRVLKPGGHIAAFGGTRTWHRLAVAIEDAGFEMRDSLAWLYGSGFPKSHDVAKGIDKLDASEERTARAREFQSWLRQHVTPQQVNAATGTDMGRHLTTHPTQPAVATADLFDKLRPHLPEVPERIEELVRQRTVESQNYAAREVTGTKKAGIATPGDVDRHTVGGSKAVEVDITAPATPEAEQWTGWGTALKPAFEPIVLARKPLAEKTVARNVLAHGTGAINVDACRIGTTGGSNIPGGIASINARNAEHGYRPTAYVSSPPPPPAPSGRWPANVLLDHHAAAWVDEQSGDRPGFATQTDRADCDKMGGRVYGNGLALKAGVRPGFNDSGGASRFFYSAKAPKTERPNVDGVQHPTVKPLAIMRWLLRLTTPPGGVTLDPFAGSGTTVEAAILEGFSPVGIELTEEYLPLIQHRIDRHRPEEPEVWDASHLDRLLEDMDELI